MTTEEAARRTPEELLDAIERSMRERRSLTLHRLGASARVVSSPVRWVRAHPWATCGAAFAGAALLQTRRSQGPTESARVEDNGTEAEDEEGVSAGIVSALLALGLRTASGWFLRKVAGATEESDAEWGGTSEG